ncbi:hypothetical protein FQA39_LY02553 [Lamprigera yunnana]|nr:hypothetical protein FQA39_LY02553 [Lamprigera yunnana]
MKVVCVQIRHTTRDEASVMLLTHYTMGCQSGFTCMLFYRRDSNIMEVQAGAQTKRLEDACTSPYFNRTSASYITLVTTTPESKECPYVGKFAVRSVINTDRPIRSTINNQQVELFHFQQNYRINKHSRTFYEAVDHIIRTKRVDRFSNCDSQSFSNLNIGCTSPDIMEFHSDCPSDYMTSYSCHGGWEENGTHYLITTPITRPSHGAHRYCFIYREYDPYLLLFSSSPYNCDRSLKPGVRGELIFNATIIGGDIENILNYLDYEKALFEINYKSVNEFPSNGDSDRPNTTYKAGKQNAVTESQIIENTSCTDDIPSISTAVVINSEVALDSRRVFKFNITIGSDFSSDSTNTDSDSVVNFLISNTKNREKHIKINEYITQVVNNYSNMDSKNHFRLMIVPGRPQLPLKDYLLLSIWIMSNQETFRSVADRFGLGRGHAHKVFIKICKMLSYNQQLYIVWPTSQQAIRTIEEFNQIHGPNSFPQKNTIFEAISVHKLSNQWVNYRKTDI